MDLYPANAQDMQDPLLALLEDYNKGDLESRCRLRRVAHSRARPGAIVRLSLCSTTPRRRRLRRGGEIQNARKDVVLQIARRLRSLIEKEGNMKVYMTRNEDIFIPLQVRVAKPRNSALTCLFLSMPTPLPVASRAVPRCLRSQPKAQPVLRQNIWHKPRTPRT